MRFSTAFRLILLGMIALASAACSAPAAPAPLSQIPPTVSAPTASQPSVPAPTFTSAPPTASQTNTPAAPPTPAAAPTVPLAPTATATASPAPPPSSTATTLRPGATPQVQMVVSGLDTPWAIAFAPDGRFFLTERPGRIRVVIGGKLDPAPWMTLEVAEAGEGGLLGLALDPQFAQNRFVYVAYTYRADGSLRNRLVRLREDAATGKGVLDKVLLDNVRGNSTHDGGRVRFGPDGKLYWTMGDVQDTAAAQNPTALLGKILRLNADGSIPADNPFPGSPVYSFGHRNPQGLAWQPGTGRLYATEHGPSGGQGCCQDEVNLIEPGKNYGWPEITGDKTRAGMVSPVIHSGASDTWAPGGADFITSGPWQGALLFTGLRGQALYRLTLDPADPRKALALEPLLKGVYGRLRDVVQGPDGAIYVLTSNGDGRGVLPADGDRVLRLTFTN